MSTLEDRPHLIKNSTAAHTLKSKVIIDDNCAQSDPDRENEKPSLSCTSKNEEKDHNNNSGDFTSDSKESHTVVDGIVHPRMVIRFLDFSQIGASNGIPAHSLLTNEKNEQAYELKLSSDRCNSDVKMGSDEKRKNLND